METLPALSHEVWEQTPPEAQAYIRALEARVKTLAAMVHTFQEQARTFQEQLNQTSQNSSRPPSSDPPSQARPRRPRSKRRRGGQPGHPGHTRTLLPVEAVEAVVVLKPEQCTHCHAPLQGDDPTPWRHQVIELPPIKPVVTEYQSGDSSELAPGLPCKGKSLRNRGVSQIMLFLVIPRSLLRGGFIGISWCARGVAR